MVDPVGGEVGEGMTVGGEQCSIFGKTGWITPLNAIFIFIHKRIKQHFCHLKKTKLSTAFCSQTVLSGCHGCLCQFFRTSVIKDDLMN